MSRTARCRRGTGDPFSGRDFPAAAPVGEVALLADTFGRWFEPGTLRAGVEVLNAAGYSVHILAPPDGERPLCCGRTFLSAGLVDEARDELRRLVDAALPYARRGIPLVGVEPSCLLTLRDEAKAMLPGEDTEAVAARALSLRGVPRRASAPRGGSQLPLRPVPWREALLHGHCHQKALGAFASVEAVLRLIPGLEVSTITATCCGMGGAFGYHAEHHDDLHADGRGGRCFPAVRAADRGHGRRRRRHELPAPDPRRRGAGAVHAAVVLEAALAGAH